MEFDERLPIPPGLLTGLDGAELARLAWFPLIRQGGTVIVAAADPRDPALEDAVRQACGAQTVEAWVCLREDIDWFIQDFLHAPVGVLIGTERTGLAAWRTTMAQWRTRLACYRTDLARGRTFLAVLRWGLGFVALADALLRSRGLPAPAFLPGTLIASGLSLALFGLAGYLRIRRSRLLAPGHTTIVEVTAATLRFVEDYQLIDDAAASATLKKTMLGRLGDQLTRYCTILPTPPDSRERTHLARERTLLAAQRTIAACYRTLYARSRTGLAFIRTGVSFIGLGFGLTGYFGLGALSLLDGLLVLAGLLMMADGLGWYLPVRKEQSEAPRA
ncbi:MAG: GspE/PulE/PilB domain-containing protein [Candidatus Geothermincolia bacterium]